jgi:hypothetical protein
MATGEAIGTGMIRRGMNGAGHVGAPDQIRKREFVQRLLELVHVSMTTMLRYMLMVYCQTDQGFVDQIWGDYLVRTGERAPG